MDCPFRTCVLLIVLVGGADVLTAQIPTPEPAPAWTATVSAGLSLTSGNADTSTVNFAYDLAIHPERQNSITSDALLLRSRDDDGLNADRVSFNVRDQYTLNTRTYLVAQTAYLHDRFKEIDYFLAPTGGLGYKLINNAAAELRIDGGLGVVGERRSDAKTQWFCMTGTERFEYAITSATTIVQSFSGIWRSSDFSNSLYSVGASITTAVTTRFETKIEALDTFRSRTSEGVQKNDLALIAAVVIKL
jgi:putative salt-induced outer membrane protein YdiY